MGDAAAKVLVVEDERHIAAGLKLNFELDDYEVHVAASGREASTLLVSQGPFDIILLDVMLPDTDGFSLCRRLRDSGDFTPVLMLTARDATEDRVKGLEAGADDYLTKPFELAELLARVRSMLRRQTWAQETQDDDVATLRFGEAEIDFVRQEARVAGEEVKLTRLEFDLLAYLSNNPGKVCSRAELQAEVWKLDNYPNTRTVDNFILRLRKQFEPDPSEPRYFVSVRGSGYKFVPDPA